MGYLTPLLPLALLALTGLYLFVLPYLGKPVALRLLAEPEPAALPEHVS